MMCNKIKVNLGNIAINKMQSPVKRQSYRIYSSSLNNIKRKQVPRIQSGYGQYNYSATSRRRLTNPEIQLLQMPAFDKKSIASIFLAPQRNSKFKLQQLDQKIEEVACNVHNLRLQANHTLKTIRYTKERLLQNDLQKNRVELKKKIVDLQDLVTITKKSHEQRSQHLRNGYIELWNSSQDLKQTIFELTLRAERIADSLGYFMRQSV